MTGRRSHWTERGDDNIFLRLAIVVRLFLLWLRMDPKLPNISTSQLASVATPAEWLDEEATGRNEVTTTFLWAGLAIVVRLFLLWLRMGSLSWHPLV